MVTGDNASTAKAIAAEAGVDDYLAEATPEDKMRPAGPSMMTAAASTIDEGAGRSTTALGSTRPQQAVVADLVSGPHTIVALGEDALCVRRVWSWPAAAAGCYLLALALVFAAWMVAGWTVERRAFQRAPYRWLVRDGFSAAGAYAQWTESIG